MPLVLLLLQLVFAGCECYLVHSHRKKCCESGERVSCPGDTVLGVVGYRPWNFVLFPFLKSTDSEIMLLSIRLL